MRLVPGPTARAGPSPPPPRRWAEVALLVFVTIALRLPFIPPIVNMGKDGWAYVEALALQAPYRVPPPGNLGFVLLGRAFLPLAGDAAGAYLLVTLGLAAAATAFFYLLAAELLPAPLATTTTLALLASPIVWFHGTPITSYPVWLAALPAIAFFALRLTRWNRPGDLFALTSAYGIASILRPDVLLFGAPMVAAAVWVARPRPRHAAVAGLILLACTCSWFFGTAALMGGVEPYLRAVSGKHAYHASFGIVGGLADGVARNAIKLVLFLAWAALPVLPVAAYGVWQAACRRRGLLLAGALWAFPALLFSVLVFMGAAGLLLLVLPVVYLAAAYGLAPQPAGQPGALRAAAGMAALFILSVAQFTLVPLLPHRTQRDVILNVTLLRYSGRGLSAGYNYNLSDFGIESSLGNTWRQFRDPAGIPFLPPRLKESSSSPRPVAPAS